MRTGVYSISVRISKGASETVTRGPLNRPTKKKQSHQRFIAIGLLACLVSMLCVPVAFSPSPSAQSCHCGCAASTANCCCKKSHAASTRWSVSRDCGSECRGATVLPLHSVALAVARRTVWTAAITIPKALIDSPVRRIRSSGHLAYLFQRPPPVS